jgi:hypothetical protein
MKMIIQFILSVGILLRYKRGGALLTKNEIESVGVMAKDLKFLNCQGKYVNIQKSLGLMCPLPYYFSRLK